MNRKKFIYSNFSWVAIAATCHFSFDGGAFTALVHEMVYQGIRAGEGLFINSSFPKFIISFQLQNMFTLKYLHMYLISDFIHSFLINCVLL